MYTFILKYLSILVFLPFIKLQNLNQVLSNKNNKGTIDKGKYRILNITNDNEINNNLKTINPYQYHFNNETIFVNRKIIKKNEYLLSKMNSSDNKMIIEISICSGEYELSFNKYNKIRNQSENISIPFLVRNENGKKIIIIDNLEYNEIVLSIWPKSNIIISDKKYYLSYMLYYYTTTDDKYKMTFIESTLTFQPIRNGGVKIIIPSIKTRDNINKLLDLNNYYFSAFITENSTFYNKMESICNLIKFFDLIDSKKTFRDLKINKKNEIIIKDIKKGKTYYVNILIKNKNTNELITFKPIVITYNDILFQNWRIALIIILIIIIIICTILIIKISKNRIEDLEKEVRNSSSSTIKNQSSISYISPSSTDNKL